MLDLEQGKISVRLSESVYNQLQADIIDFAFKNNNDGYNENAFFNKLIPNLIVYRMGKRSQLRNYITNNFANCIKDTYKEQVYDILDDIFNTVYFNDYNENYHNLRIHFRLNKDNLLELSNIFAELKNNNINKTSYIRNLLNEYCYMNRGKREWLCYKTEFDLFNSSQSEVSVIDFIYRNKPYTICYYDLVLHKNNNEWFIIGFDINKPLYVRAFRLCEIRNITFGEDINLTISEECRQIVNEYIDSAIFSKKPILNLKLKGIKLQI